MYFTADMLQPHTSGVKTMTHRQQATNCVIWGIVPGDTFLACHKDSHGRRAITHQGKVVDVTMNAGPYSWLKEGRRVCYANSMQVRYGSLQPLNGEFYFAAITFAGQSVEARRKAYASTYSVPVNRVFVPPGTLNVHVSNEKGCLCLEEDLPRALRDLLPET